MLHEENNNESHPAISSEEYKSLKFTADNLPLKKIIILNIGVAEGKGDWIHGVEIAKYIKETFKDRYIIIGFVAGMFPLEHQRFGSIKPYFAVIPEINEYKKQDKKYFDDLFTWCDDDGKLDLAKEYNSIIHQYYQQILFEAKISFLIQCVKLLDENKDLLIYPVVSLAEYGQYYKINTINLNMGFSEELSRPRHGIRIYQKTEFDHYWLQVQQENPDFYKELFEDYESCADYFADRKLLPGDIRGKEELLGYIKINLFLYGDKCDFYLPATIVEQSSAAMHNPIIIEEIQQLCAEYQLQCIYVKPDFNHSISVNNAGASCRIFAGFDLSREVYDRLALYNQEAGVAVSGDNGVSFGISGRGLLFFGNLSSEAQSCIVRDIVTIAEQQNLTAIAAYYRTFFPDPKLKIPVSTRVGNLITMLEEQASIILEQNAILMKELCNRNIFDKISAYIQSIDLDLKTSLPIGSKVPKISPS